MFALGAGDWFRDVAGDEAYEEGESAVRGRSKAAGFVDSDGTCVSDPLLPVVPSPSRFNLDDATVM